MERTDRSYSSGEWKVRAGSEEEFDSHSYALAASPGKGPLGGPPIRWAQRRSR